MLDDVWSWSYAAYSIGSIILVDWGHTPVGRRIFYNHRIKCFPELIYVIFLSKYLISAIQSWCYTFLYTYILYDSDKCYISSNDSIYLHHLMEWGDITILYILLIDTEVSIDIHTPQSAIPTHTIYIYLYIYISVYSRQWFLKADEFRILLQIGFIHTQFNIYDTWSNDPVPCINRVRMNNRANLNQ